MNKFNNYVRKLEDAGYNVSTTLEEYKLTQHITFECVEEHVTTLKITTLCNKYYKNQTDLTKLCTECSIAPSIEEKKAKEKCEELGFTFISRDPKTRIVYFDCVCGESCQSNAQNLCKETKLSGCVKCLNIARRKDIEDIRQTFTNAGCVLLSTERQHKDDPVQYICDCGEIAFIRESDFIRGRRCDKCCVQRRENTCVEKYGVTNPMHKKEFVELALKNSYSKKDYVFPSGRTEKIMGYENVALDYLLYRGRIPNKKKRGIPSHFLKEEDIIVNINTIPTIVYKYDGVEKTYYPDIYIPRLNTLIEVKSTYTWNKDIHKNFAKFKQTSMMTKLVDGKEIPSYNFELWIIGEKNKKIYRGYFENGIGRWFCNDKLIEDTQNPKI